MASVTSKRARERQPLVFFHPPEFGGMGRASSFVLAATQVAPAQRISLTTPGRTDDAQGRVTPAAVIHLAKLFLRFVHALRKRPSVVYLPIAQWGVPLLRDLLIVAVALSTRHRVLVHLHGSQLARELQMQGRRVAVMRSLLKRCDWIVLSTAVRGLLVQAGFDAERVAVIPNPAHPAVGCTPPKDPPPLRVGFLGAVCREKGIDVAIAAVAALRGAGRPVTLLIAGPVLDGPVPVAEGIEYIGKLPPDDVDEAFWNQVDCLLLPARWEEGQPYVVLEALQRRRPVLTTYAAGLSELIDSGALMLVQPAAAACEVALTQLLEQYQQLRDAQQAAWAEVAAHHEPAKVRELLVGELTR